MAYHPHRNLRREYAPNYYVPNYYVPNYYVPNYYVPNYHLPNYAQAPYNRPELQQRPAELQVPYHLRPDLRLPPPGSDLSKPVPLVTDGYETHCLLLLPPGSALLENVLDIAKKSRSATIETPPEDLVERALDRNTLIHISDGPTGGIWVVAAGKEELISCLVLEMRGGWEVLGIGKGISDGDTFLRHPCGFGPEVKSENE